MQRRFGLTVILHGQTKADVEGYFHGHQEIPDKSELTTLGIFEVKQAASLFLKIRGVEFKSDPEKFVFVTSKLSCSKQASYLFFDVLASQNYPRPSLLNIMNDYKPAEECNFGNWEGCKIDDLISEEREKAELFLSGDVLVRPSGEDSESLASLVVRVDEFLNQLEKNYSEKRPPLIDYSSAKKMFKDGLIKNLRFPGLFLCLIWIFIVNASSEPSTLLTLSLRISVISPVIRC